jgi:cyanophycin synthetase
MLYKNKKISYQNYFNDNKRNESQSNKKYLRDICINNIPYPKTINNLNINNLDKINKLKFPVLLKPVKGAGGKGIIDIDSFNILRKYINTNNNSEYIAQEKIIGNTYRILILYDEILFIRTNKQPFVIGDGISTVKNLIDKLNFNLKSNKKPHVRRVSYNLIKQQGYNIYNVVDKNRIVYITDIINYWNGAVNGEFIPLNKVHQDNIKLFFKIKRVFDLNLVGIDFISTNLEEPYYNNNGCLLEINNSPQFNISITEYPEKFIKTLIKNV